MKKYYTGGGAGFLSQLLLKKSPAFLDRLLIKLAEHVGSTLSFLASRTAASVTMATNAFLRGLVRSVHAFLHGIVKNPRNRRLLLEGLLALGAFGATSVFLRGFIRGLCRGNFGSLDKAGERFAQALVGNSARNFNDVHPGIQANNDGTFTTTRDGKTVVPVPEKVKSTHTDAQGNQQIVEYKVLSVQSRVQHAFDQFGLPAPPGLETHKPTKFIPQDNIPYDPRTACVISNGEFANGCIVRFADSYWLVTAAHVAADNIQQVHDHAGQPVVNTFGTGSFENARASFGHADVYVQEVSPIAGKAYELSQSAPTMGFLKSNWYDEANKVIKCKVTRGEIYWAHAYSAGTVAHGISPCCPGDSGSPILDGLDGRLIGIHVGGTDGNIVPAENNHGAMVQAATIINTINMVLAQRINHNPVIDWVQSSYVHPLPSWHGKRNKGNFARSGALDYNPQVLSWNREVHIPRDRAEATNNVVVSETKTERKQAFKRINPQESAVVWEAIQDAAKAVDPFHPDRLADQVKNYLCELEELMRLANSQFHNYDSKIVCLREVLPITDFKAKFWYSSLPKEVDNVLKFPERITEFSREVFEVTPGPYAHEDAYRQGRGYKHVGHVATKRRENHINNLRAVFEKYKHPSYYRPALVEPTGPAWADIEDSDGELSAHKGHPSAVPIAAALKSVVIKYEEKEGPLSQLEVDYLATTRRQHGIIDKAFNVAIPYDHVLINRAVNSIQGGNPKSLARDLVEAAFNKKNRKVIVIFNP